MPKPYVAIALAAALVPAVAQAAERTPEGELRKLAANASMAYMNCRLDAQAAINTIRGKRAARMEILPGDSSKVSTCVAKAKEGVYDHIPEMNALISAHRSAAGLIKDWYESLISAMDRLNVDVANLRDSDDAVPELGSKLERAASELR